MEELDKVKESIEQLKAQISCHNHRYYVLDSSEIGDAEYDELMRELKQLGLPLAGEVGGAHLDIVRLVKESYQLIVI